MSIIHFLCSSLKASLFVILSCSGLSRSVLQLHSNIFCFYEFLDSLVSYFYDFQDNYIFFISKKL